MTGKITSPVHLAGVQRLEATPLHPGKADDVILCRNVLNSQAFSLPLAMGMRTKTLPQTITSLDDETGTIIDVMRRRQSYMLNRLQSLHGSVGEPDRNLCFMEHEANDNSRLPYKASRHMPRNSTSIDIFPRLHRLLSLAPRPLSYTPKNLSRERLPPIESARCSKGRPTEHTEDTKLKAINLLKQESLLSVLADEACFYQVLKGTQSGAV